MHTIIVGVDGSERSADALSFAYRLTTAANARMLLVHVVGVPSVTEAGLYEPYSDMLRDESAAMLRRMQSLVGQADPMSVRTIMRGSPAQGIQEIAEQEHAALVVVGSSHVGRFGRVLPGSTGERLLHGAPCPVAIVPRGLAGRPWSDLRVIGLADDAGRESRAARDAAVALARSTGAALQIIEVCDVVHYGSPALMYGPGYYALRDDIRATVRAELDAAIESLPEDMRAQPVMLEGDPADRLIAASKDLDLLVLGSRGYGPMHAVLAGGVSGRVAREAACPVIVVPRGAATSALRSTAAAADATA